MSMRMKTTLSSLLACFCVVLGVATIGAQTPKAKRINRAIELLEQGQPIYYTGSHSGTEGSFEQGKKDAQIYADYISYDMEHAPYDIKGLADYMRGLVAGGPTKSGHRTPAVAGHRCPRDHADPRGFAGRGTRVCGSRAVPDPQAGSG